MTTTPYATRARALLRTTLLDAMHGLLEQRPWAEITMAHVAEAAGVSRPTLYKELGSRDELAQAYVLREVERFLGTVEEAVRAHLDDPVTALEAAFEVFLTIAAKDPLVREVVTGDGGELLPLVTTRGAPVIDHATERLTSVLCAGWPQLEERRARLLAETVVRLAISYAASPSGPSDLTGRSVAELLGPYVLDAVADARS